MLAGRTDGGDGNVAFANGGGTYVVAGSGDANTATVKDHDSWLPANYGSNNVSSVRGDNRHAITGGDINTPSSDNVAIIKGDNQTLFVPPLQP